MHSVLVLAGGLSPEREVSLRSGASVREALEQAGYHVSVLDPADDLEKLMAVAQKVDVVFPVLHGAGGEDGSIQLLLEKRGILFVGSGSASSQLCFDKNNFKAFLLRNKFPTPAGELVDAATFATHPLTRKPYVLKPHDGGSSIDTFIIRRPDTQDDAAIREAFSRHPRMLLEELIDGTEITVSILNGKPLPVIEIVPPTDQEFDYKNKYNGATQELCPPQHVPTEVQASAQALAADIHDRAGCGGLSRTDMIIDRTGAIYILETNTIPGMTTQSLLPKAAEAAGMDMPALVKTLVEDVLR